MQSPNLHTSLNLIYHMYIKIAIISNSVCNFTPHPQEYANLFELIKRRTLPYGLVMHSSKKRQENIDIGNGNRSRRIRLRSW